MQGVDLEQTRLNGLRSYIKQAQASAQSAYRYILLTLTHNDLSDKEKAEFLKVGAQLRTMLSEWPNIET